VQTPEQTVLIDTACGPNMAPTAGRMMANLQAAGITPDDIDVVLLTHLHRDHVGGLLDADGRVAFPRAKLLMPEAEAVYWLDEGAAAAAPEDKRPAFTMAQQSTAPYGAAMQTFTAEEPLPGIKAVPLPGHTPGHTGYEMGAGDDRLLIWGDICHAPDVQTRRPEAAVIFDVDQPLAIATRRAILARAADERLLIAGMHMHFPAFVRIAREGDGYAVRPIAWLSEL
jgi:glyoxylase-like metal-dependent hydrolase (beta-lactamase superfamily II)